MKAIILAARKEKKIRPYTKDRPKCMVEINGVSLLDRQIAVIRSLGIEEIILIGEYKGDSLLSKGSKLIMNPRYQETNMVWSLFCGEDELQGDLIISYGDIFYSREILDNLLKCDDEIAITIDMDWEKYWCQRNENPLVDAKTLKLGNGGTIREIGQVPLSINDIEGQYMGLMKFSQSGVELLRESFRRYKEMGLIMNKVPEMAYMTDLVMQLIKDGIKIQSVPVRLPWIEVDTKEDLVSSYTLERISLIEKSYISTGGGRE